MKLYFNGFCIKSESDNQLLIKFFLLKKRNCKYSKDFVHLWVSLKKEHDFTLKSWR